MSGVISEGGFLAIRSVVDEWVINECGLLVTGHLWLMSS